MEYTHLVQIGVRSVYIVVLMVVSFQAIGQNWDRVDFDFRRDGRLLVNSGINGLVAPQFSNTDFNGDGNTDLFVFDRQSGAVMTFVWDDSGEEGQLRYAPEYANDFPEMIRIGKLLDYDRDGDEDLFMVVPTFATNSISLYRNEGSQTEPDYERVKYPNAGEDVLNFQLNNGSFTAIYVSPIDVPAIADVDSDGDIDILVFEQISGSKVHYMQNMQVEKDLPKDSMFFKRVDFCWGQFKESGIAADIFLSDSPDDCATGLWDDEKATGGYRHAGSTMEVFDNNGDGLMDCLIGDLSNNGIVYLENGGTPDNDWMVEQSLDFPSVAERVDMPVFLTPVFVDVNNDGNRDLIISQNTTNSGNNTNHIWMYENIGSDSNPTFKLRTKNFLHETSLQIPEGSKPTFVDIDQDGRLDLLIGSYGFNFETVYGDVRLFHFRNTGTVESASFTYQTDDYLNISQYTNISRTNPAFGDLNGDGALDLLIGEDMGTLIYYENKAAAGSPMVFEEPVFNYFDIKFGNKSKPQLVDLTGDGLLDLVVGQTGDNIDPQTGIIGSPSFYENMGSVTEPMFSSTPTTQSLGGIYTRTQSTNNSEADPVFIPTENHEDFIAIVGSNYGELFLYEDVVDNILDSFTLITDSIPVPRYGWRTGVDAADIDNDNYYEIVIGNENGGLAFHNTPYRVLAENAVDGNLIQDVAIYPNPVGDMLTIASDAVAQHYTITDIAGRLLIRDKIRDSQIYVGGLVPGFYILTLDFGVQRNSVKFVKQ